MLHVIAAARARVSGSGVGLEGKCWSNLGGCQDKRKTVWVRIFCWGEGEGASTVSEFWWGARGAAILFSFKNLFQLTRSAHGHAIRRIYIGFSHTQVTA